MPTPRRLMRPHALAAALLSFAVAATPARGAPCGPFGDVPSTDPFCPAILEIFYLGLTAGSAPPGIFGPTLPVTRAQLAAILARASDGAVLSGTNRRAALDQFWTTQGTVNLGLTSLGFAPGLCKADGDDIWVSGSSGRVFRVRAGDGRLVDTWTGATDAAGVLSAMGKIFVAGSTAPGSLYQIDPSQPAGPVTTVAITLGNNPTGIAYDGSRIWTANQGGSVSIVTPGATLPWAVTTVTAGFTGPYGILYDGANIWVTDRTMATLLKLDASGAVQQTVSLSGADAEFPIFDGTNIWVPNGNSVTVVHAASGDIRAVLTDNGLSDPSVAAFDGQRVLVTSPSGPSVSLWQASDLSAIDDVGTGGGTLPLGACSDGINFWIALAGAGQLARF